MTPLSASEVQALIAYAASPTAPATAVPTDPNADVEALLAKVNLPVPPKRRCAVALLTNDEFLALPEYSLTDPTGFTPGLRWKRDANTTWEGSRGLPSWWLCEYRLKGGQGYVISKKIIVRWTLEIAASHVEHRRAQRAAHASAPRQEGTCG